MNFFFLSAIFISITLSSPTVNSFSDEQNKIMIAFDKLNSSERLHSRHYSIKDFKDHFEILLKLDAVIFWKGMSKVTDKIFLFTFWNTFNSSYLFLCDDEYNRKTRKEFKDFIPHVHNSNNSEACATDMLYHFKLYLMKAMATCQADRVQKMLFEAENFYTLRLKGLILEVLDG
jgi:hypothetical protein